jgi:hypothetical protein
MPDREQPFEELNYRIAAKLFESAFKACEQVSHEHRQALLKTVAERIMQQMPKAPSEKPAPLRVIGVEIKQS